jgi:DNA-directed RNA polymerase specialized sigma24 family protein
MAGEAGGGAGGEAGAGAGGEAVAALRACGEACDFETWAEFDRHFRRRLVAGVVRALGRGGCRADGEEVGERLQEVYCRLLDDGCAILRRFRGRTDSEAYAYLKRIAETVTVDRLRLEAAEKRGRYLVSGGVEELVGDRVADLGPSPEARAVHRDACRRLWAACRKQVRTRHRARDLAILQLALFEGWSSREISNAMGGRLSVSSIDTVLHRLRRRLAACGLDLPPRRAVAALEVAEGFGSSVAPTR